MSESPEYDTIDLPANQTIVITQPLEITHSVTIVGNNATLYFQQGNTAAWPADASGAIYVDDPGYTNIQVDLEDFTIKFDMSAADPMEQPRGDAAGALGPREQPRGHRARRDRHAGLEYEPESRHPDLDRHDDLRPPGLRRLLVCQSPGPAPPIRRHEP